MNATHAAGRSWTVGHRGSGELALGILTALLGIAALVWPKASLLIIALVFAISLLAHGIALIAAAIADRLVLPAALGLLALLAGVLCLIAPLKGLALIIGVWWILSSIPALIVAMTGTAADARWWAALRGVLGLAGGLFILFQPQISLHALTIIAGIGLIAFGLLQIIDATRKA
jgi:uncharacterized membrane protein HdeD (DUF308 family)